MEELNRKLKIIHVIPIEKGSNGMPFVFRQIDSMKGSFPIETKLFYLESRTSLSYLIEARKRLKHLIKEFSPDLVHGHYGSVNSLFTVFSSSKPTVITYHGSDLNKTISDGALRNFMARLFSNVAVLFASKVIVVSQKLKDNIWWSKRKVTIIPVGTKTDEFYPFSKEEALKQLGEEYDISYPTIVFNANNPMIKRLDLAEKAIDLLKQEYPDAHLFKLEGDFPPERVPLLLNVADALLLCSDSEGSPTIIKEAMACNLPIVSTDVGDVKQRVEGVYEAMIVEQNERALSKGLSETLKLDRQKLNGRKVLIENKLDEPSLQVEVFKVYQKVIASAKF